MDGLHKKEGPMYYMNQIVKLNGSDYRIICIVQESNTVVAAKVNAEGGIIEKVYIREGEAMTKEMYLLKQIGEYKSMLDSFVMVATASGKRIRSLYSSKEVHEIRKKVMALESELEDLAA